MQTALARAALLSSTLASASPALTGILLIAAGLWQLTPLKRACLRHCRSPVDLLVRRRRNGRLGALRMGLEHGAYCLGCCWLLMALLFAAGIMNLFWIVGLTAIVLVEKVLPRGDRFGRVTGVVLTVTGTAMLAQP